MAGQSINDRLAAARYSIAGQGLAKSVCKSTTEEVIGPKKKHLDYLLHCTNEPNVSIPQLANLLIDRTSSASWVVVFKALVTVHHLMCYGNERFTQYLASSNSSFQLGGFLDKTNVQGYDMSTFIRRYAKYLNEKALSYRTVAFDFCKVKRGKDDGTLRTMNAEKLLKTLPVLQNQIDALLEFDCTANELSNGVINAAFMLLFRDLIRLFACYNDGIINLLEKYFDMNKKMCRDALDIYKKFLIRMDRVAEFLKVAENVGIDKGDIPDLAKAPSSLLDALEQHLAALEGKKASGAGTPTQPAVKPAYLKSAVNSLSSTSASFGSVASAGKEVNGVGLEENLKKLALEEEQAALNQLREKRMKELNQQGSQGTNPFLSSPVEGSGGMDLLDISLSSPPSAQTSGTTKASDDLFNLKSNPFADVLLDASQHQQNTNSASSNLQNDIWGTQNGFSSSNSTTTNAFASENSFAAVFGSNSHSTSMGASSLMTATLAPGFDMLGDVLQPANSVGSAANAGVNASNQSSKSGPPTSKVITGDLDSSIASLAQNLDINRGMGSLQKGSHMWNSPKNTVKTGGANWAPHVASSTGAWNSPQHSATGTTQPQTAFAPPIAPMTGGGVVGGADWTGGVMGSAFPQPTAAPMMAQQPFMGGPRPMAPAMGMGAAPMGMPAMGIQPQPMFNAAAVGIPPRPGIQPMAGFGTPPVAASHQPAATALDPFGALM